MTVTRSTRRVGVIAAAGTLVASSAAATIVLLATGGSAYATTSVGSGLPDPTISPTALLSPTPLPTSTSTTTTVVPLPTLSATSSPTPTASPTATSSPSPTSTSDTTTSTSTSNTSTRTTTSSGASRGTAGSSKAVAVKAPASVKLPGALSANVPAATLPSVFLAKAETATFVPPTLSIPALGPILLPATAGQAAPAQGLAPLLAGPMMPYAAPSGANAPAAAPVHDNVNLAASRNGTGGGAPIIMFGLCVFAILLGMRGAGRLRVRIRAKLRG